MLETKAEIAKSPSNQVPPPKPSQTNDKIKKKVTIVFDNMEDNRSDDSPRERTYTTAENMMISRLDTIYRKKN